jgi:hypothetical protein
MGRIVSDYAEEMTDLATAEAHEGQRCGNCQYWERLDFAFPEQAEAFARRGCPAELTEHWGFCTQHGYVTEDSTPVYQRDWGECQDYEYGD